MIRKYFKNQMFLSPSSKQKVGRYTIISNFRLISKLFRQFDFILIYFRSHPCSSSHKHQVLVPANAGLPYPLQLSPGWNISQQITFIDVDLQTETRFRIIMLRCLLSLLPRKPSTYSLQLVHFRRKIPARTYRHTHIQC